MAGCTGTCRRPVSSATVGPWPPLRSRPAPQGHPRPHRHQHGLPSRGLSSLLALLWMPRGTCWAATHPPGLGGSLGASGRVLAPPPPQGDSPEMLTCGFRLGALDWATQRPPDDASLSRPALPCFTPCPSPRLLLLLLPRVRLLWRRRDTQATSVENTAFVTPASSFSVPCQLTDVTRRVPTALTAATHSGDPSGPSQSGRGS